MVILMSPAQFRMARAALRWGLVETAKRANVSTSTIVRFERGDVLKSITVNHLKTILEVAGIEFISEGRGEGVLLRRDEFDQA